MITSYPSIYNFGHKHVEPLFDGNQMLYVEEKIDGSQFSFSLTYDGELEFRSKGRQIDVFDIDKMFMLGCKNILELKDKLVPGLIYRGEYLNKPKHNILCYERVPLNNVIIFDIGEFDSSFISKEAQMLYANRANLETSPILWHGKELNEGILNEILKTPSVLGGKIEGVVIKQASPILYGVDKKLLVAKFVSQEFKEVHKKEWKSNNPKGKDILEALSFEYLSEARWNKAIQHLKETGSLTKSTKDIGKLLIEIRNDIKKECEDEIKRKLFSWAWPHIERSCIKGFPEFYKERIIEI